MDSRRAWMIAIGAFAVNVAVASVVRSLGAFFDAMAADYGSGRGATALIFSLTSCLGFLLGVVTGPLVDRIGPRPLLAAAAASIFAGLVLTANATSLWMAYATYGLGVGIASGCTYIPLLATITGWFDRQRVAALSVVVAGIGTGAFIGNPLAAALIDAAGYRAAYVMFGSGAATVLLVCTMIVERPPRTSAPSSSTALADIRATLRDRSFTRFYAAGSVMSMGMFVPFVFVTPYAQEHGASAFAAAMLAGVMGLAGIASRVGVVALARRASAMEVYRACSLVMALTISIWLLSTGSLVALFVFAIAFGAVQGAWIAITPSVITQTFGTERVGTTMGIWFTAGAVGSLAGPPSAGALTDVTGGYQAAIAVAIALVLAGWAILRTMPADEPEVDAPAVSMRPATTS
jgi:predicted MFS family arabinose efflux permease